MAVEAGPVFVETQERPAVAGVLLVIPALNEEAGLGTVLRQAQELALSSLVIDGGSTDRTREVAEEQGVTVLDVGRGKGRAWRDFLDCVDLAAYERVAMVDADGSYDLAALPRMLASDADMVIGLRRRLPQATPLHRLLGGTSLSAFAGLMTLTRCPDLLSGLRLIRSDSLRQVRLTSERFGLEAELTIEFIRRGFSIDWVDVDYRPRYGDSKLRALPDGIDILKTILQARFRRL